MGVAEHDWEQAVALLEGADEVALACHVDPDGDALGSMLALHHALRRRGVRTVASWGSATPADPATGRWPLLVPPQYTFLPGIRDLVPVSEFPRAPKVLVAFDTGSPDRLGSLRPAAEAAGTVLVIDHHASGESFGDVRLMDPDAAATAVLVAELIDRLGVAFDRDIATCLYVGLVTDTGRFQYASTTPEVMRLGARLIAQDIDHAAINRRVFETHSFGYLKVLGRALERARLEPAAGLAWTAVLQRDIDDLGIAMSEVEGLIDVLRAVESAECSLVCKEQPSTAGGPRRWKASLRSKGGVDVGRVAAALGGGGHAFAAGFIAEGELEDVVARVVDELLAADADHGDAGETDPADRPVVAVGDRAPRAS